MYLHRLPHRPYAVRTAELLASGASPFDVAGPWLAAHDISRVDASAISAWNQYRQMCEMYGRPPTPITVTGLNAFMLYYVLVRGNSSANLNSELSKLHSFAAAQSPAIAWPDFEALGKGTMTAFILRVQKDWPASVSGAPALTYKLGLTRAIQYLHKLPQTLWSLQWIAVLSLMHALLLRPHEILPPDKFPVAPGTFSAWMYPRMGEFSFIAPDAAACFLGGLQYVIALSKTMKSSFDSRRCTAAALDLGPVVVNAPRALREYLTAAGLTHAPDETPIVHYRNRNGSPRPKMTRADFLL